MLMPALAPFHSSTAPGWARAGAPAARARPAAISAERKAWRCIAAGIASPGRDAKRGAQPATAFGCSSTVQAKTARMPARAHVLRLFSAMLRRRQLSEDDQDAQAV